MKSFKFIQMNEKDKAKSHFLVHCSLFNHLQTFFMKSWRLWPGEAPGWAGEEKLNQEELCWAAAGRRAWAEASRQETPPFGLFFTASAAWVKHTLWFLNDPKLRELYNALVLVLLTLDGTRVLYQSSQQQVWSFLSWSFYLCYHRLWLLFCIKTLKD